MSGDANALTALDIVTLVVALIGAITGVAALAWGVAQHRLTGARVKVALVGGWAMGGGLASGPLDTIRRPDGAGDAVVGVQVRNVGRLPAVVTVWGVRAGKASCHSEAFSSFNPPLPKRIEVGEELTWYLPADMVATHARVTGQVLGNNRLSARVVLGTGEEITSKAIAATNLRRLAAGPA